MAEILLNGVLTKLGGFTVDTILQLSGVKGAIKDFPSLSEITKEVKELMEELSSIQSLIKDADKRSIVDETKKKWLMDLIEIAYQIEDAVDTFLLKCPIELRGIKSLRGILRFLNKFSKLPFLYNFQKEVKDIRRKVSGIHVRGKNYNANNLGEVTRSISVPKLDPVGDPEVVGFEEDVKYIVNNLCDENNKSLAVVSIVGPGGLGKTTLARKVCYSDRVRSKFGKPTWITISQTYDLLYVLNKIAKSFGIQLSSDMDANEIAQEITEHLAKRNYLIVLDDVWTKELCDNLLINGVLPDNKNGSCVLVTTRDINVVKYVPTRHVPYKLNFLDPHKSLELFLKNASHERDRSDRASTNQDEIAKKFVKKCGGLPLALIVLGRLLFTTPYHHWEKLLDTMSWQDYEIDKCSKVIATSYEHLPFEKKFCFMYFAAFPEDIEIAVRPLLRMWIAEGLIPPEEPGEQRTMEQIAERFLEDLVHRSLVQVSGISYDGSMNFLRVHDIVRDLAIQKAKEINFLMVCSKKNDWNTSFPFQ